ncbi:hypothetical protein F5I97DRAFT_625975 [Phlebopus sp. FC_14]|nr:hypothetical protein F5I97DRAFT_625975 [Phlebopus sp. FC_14]
MSAVSHGTRHLRQGIGNFKHGPTPVSTSRSIHIPSFIPRPTPPAPTTTQRIFSQARSFFSRLATHLAAPGLTQTSVPVPAHASKSLLRPAHYHSGAQSIRAGFSLPVRHALSRPLSAPCLPKPPGVPANVTHVGLGTARAFHSGRPIFQNLVDNVPIATRALWEAEWEVKMKKKEARKMRKAKENLAPTSKSQEMLKPEAQPIVVGIRNEHADDASELDIYFPLESPPVVTTHLLVPLAPTPTARLPLSSHTIASTVQSLVPIPELQSIHQDHRKHSLRVSTLFARLDVANVWDDPGVNIDAYAYAPRSASHLEQERLCTILRVTFAGWPADRVRAIVGESAEGWCSLEEIHLASAGLPTEGLDDPSESQDSLLSSSSVPSVDLDSIPASELQLAEDTDDDLLAGSGPSSSLMSTDSTWPDFILPTLDFSSSFTEAVRSVPPAPQPEIFLRTASELARDGEERALASCASSLSSPSSLSPSDAGEFPFSPVQARGPGERALDFSWDSSNLRFLSASFMERAGNEVNGW